MFCDNKLIEIYLKKPNGNATDKYTFQKVTYIKSGIEKVDLKLNRKCHPTQTHNSIHGCPKYRSKRT